MDEITAWSAVVSASDSGDLRAELRGRDVDDASTGAAVAAASASATLRDRATLMAARLIGAPSFGDGTRAVGTVGTAPSTVSAGTLARVKDSVRSESGENSPREVSCDDLAEKLRKHDAVLR